MYSHKHFTAFLGVLALIMSLTACSSQDMPESLTSASGIQETQSETPEPKEQKEDVQMSGLQEDGSPEDIIKEYLAGLRDSDVGRMMDTFAEDSYAKPCIPVGKEAVFFDNARLPALAVSFLTGWSTSAIEIISISLPTKKPALDPMVLYGWMPRFLPDKYPLI